MEFRILGPLEVVGDAGAVSISAGKQRALLARLLLDANRTVSVERLVDDLWGDDVPETATKMVQIAVSQLRKVLPDGTIRTSPPGYVLAIDDERLDLARFERLRAAGQALAEAGQAAPAAEKLREALALWRGPALGDLTEPFARLEAARLEELRLGCLEARIDADLARGRHDDLVAELEGLVARHPLRERLRRQQVIALYRCGRHADGLAALAAYRRELDETLGIEPSAEMRELERRVLRQDANLDREAERRSAPMPPAVRYVSSGDVSIAYHVVGGPCERDIVLVHGWVCSFHSGWERPQIAAFYRRLAGLGRLVLFDKRGTGLSDRVRGIASLEERMDDVRAVMDAVGSERAVVIGISEGGPMVTLFAATHPDRTAGLVTMGSYPRRLWAPDYPIGPREPEALWWARSTPEEWGSFAFAQRFLAERAPTIAGDEDAVAWYASYFVRGASPSAVRQIGQMNAEIDVRHVLSTIHVPALVLHREREFFAEASAYLGERIPGARVVALPGVDHLPWEGDQDAVLSEVERFVAGLDDEPVQDRVLATVLVVQAADAERACDAVREQLARFRGRELELHDDTVVVTFDGPARAIRCAQALSGIAISSGRVARAAMHTGECDVVGGALAGFPVDLTRRLVEEAEWGEALATSTVRDLVAGSGIGFEERAPVGDVTGDGWRLFRVRPPDESR